MYSFEEVRVDPELKPEWALWVENTRTKVIDSIVDNKILKGKFLKQFKNALGVSIKWNFPPELIQRELDAYKEKGVNVKKLVLISFDLSGNSVLSAFVPYEHMDDIRYAEDIANAAASEFVHFFTTGTSRGSKSTN